jgi:Alpha amylase, catalytic domain
MVACGVVVQVNAQEVVDKHAVQSWKQSPTWARDLVIYEIATKAFTSPQGPESGTFESLRTRLSYLQDLGITGIWLTGHSLSDPKHFLNVWSQYAVIEPDTIDPSLGSSGQFKALIDDAHSRGIRIFLDVITHGVMPQSSLVKHHPEWFLGTGWGGMREYDWLGGHTDLDDWWVRMWSDYVTRYGVDGFRLDLGTTRPDLWARIRAEAFAAGHPIVLFEEGLTTIPGVTDFGQANNWISDGNTYQRVMLEDIPGYYRTKFGRHGDYKVDILYADNTTSQGEVSKTGSLAVRLDGLATDRVSQRRGWILGAFGPDGIPDVQLAVSGVSTRVPLKHVTVSLNDPRFMSILSAGERVWSADVVPNEADETAWTLTNPFQAEPLSVTGKAPEIQIHLPTLDHGNSIMLSCHDNGQTGFPPENPNPYSAKDSRATFGYSFLFTPMIPIFMSGEEFDATFRALPSLSPDLYGGKNPGTGHWLYGSMLNWKELDQAQHREMMEDVKRMLALRRLEPDLLMPQLRGDVEPRLISVRHTSDIDVPVPYMRWTEGAAIVVAANRNTERDAHLTLQIPVSSMGRAPSGEYAVNDIWNGGGTRIYSEEQLDHLPYTIRRDRTARGGIGVLKITWAP